jgi:O-antigen/teichoic acid export membrane protein
MIIGFSLLGGLFVATLVGALMLFRDGHVEPLLLAVSAFVALGQNLHDGARYLLFSQRKGLYAIVLDATRYGTLALIVAGLALSGQTVTPQGLLTVIGCCALFPGLAALVPYALKARRLSRLLPVITASNWRSARWLVLMVLVTTSLDQITYMATAATLGDEAVGALRIGLYCTGLYGLLLVTLEKIVPRRAGEALRRGGDAELRRFLMRAALYSGLPSLALMFGFAIPAAFWLELVFGKGAGAHAVLMQWATLGFFFVFVREFAMVYLRTIGETRSIFLSFSVSTSIALLGLWPAGHLFGLPGLAAMLTLGHAISAVLIVTAARRH